MKIALSAGKSLIFILALYLGLSSVSLTNAAPRLIYGGEFIATNSGPLLLGNNALNAVDHVQFSTTFKSYAPEGQPLVMLAVCSAEGIDYIIRAGAVSEFMFNPKFRNLPLYENESNYEVSVSPGIGGNEVVTGTYGPVGGIITASFSHAMSLSVLYHSTIKPFDIVTEHVFDCAAFDSRGYTERVESLVYYKMRVKDIYVSAMPSISAPSLVNLGSCPAQSSQVLSKYIPVTLNHEGRHSDLIGSLSATVTGAGDTNDLVLLTENNDNLAQKSVEIPPDFKGDYPLKASVICPKTAGTYNWSVLLTYTIQ